MAWMQMLPLHRILKFVNKLTYIILYLSFIGATTSALGQSFNADSIPIKDNDSYLVSDTLPSGTARNFFLSDTAIMKLKKRQFTRLIYESVVNERNEPQEETHDNLNQYEELFSHEGKRIKSIRVVRLDAFGPSFEDTARVSSRTTVRWMNVINSKTNKETIHKNIFIKEGEQLNTEDVLDNERIIRQLPYIKDARIVANVCADNPNEVELIVMTKDVFSYRVVPELGGVEKGSLALTNKNSWGLGHEIMGKFIWDIGQDHYGFEGAYNVNNLLGTFTNMNFSYKDTDLHEGLSFELSKPFIRMNTTTGGAINIYRSFKTNSYYEPSIPIEEPLNYGASDIWAGYGFNVGKTNQNDFERTQLVFAGRYRNVHFYEHPPAGEDGKQYFANSNLYLASISLSRRYFIRDHHVFAYGITEDIPKGFLHEFIFGYDNNEFKKRYYTHLYLSSGNLLNYRPSYMFLSVSLGTFFNNAEKEQGKLELKWSFISKQFEFRKQIIRTFLNVNYQYGINRFEQEYLNLNTANGIRGFSSIEPQGKQRLVLNTESVLFLQRKLWGFNVALFDYLDFGILANSNQMIYNGDWYAGMNVGVRFRNENLIFDTIQIRLGFYPFSPPSQVLFDFNAGSVGRGSYFNFQPRKPAPLDYQ